MSSFQVEKDYYNYPDSVIPILTILRLICSSESSVRRELSTRIDLYSNILRSKYNLFFQKEINFSYPIL